MRKRSIAALAGVTMMERFVDSSAAVRVLVTTPSGEDEACITAQTASSRKCLR
jgi:hypothetical protein